MSLNRKTEILVNIWNIEGLNDIFITYKGSNYPNKKSKTLIRKIIELSKEEFIAENKLRQKSLPVTDFGKDFQQEVNDLVETFENIEIATGLSAPQIGIFKRFAIINPEKNEGNKDHLIIVNPEIIKLSGSRKGYKEKCRCLDIEVKLSGEIS